MVLALSLTSPAEAGAKSGLSEPPARPDPDPESVLTAEEARAVEWARSRFEQAGLELPPRIEVAFDPTREACGWSEGRYVGNGRDVNEVTICAPSSDTAAADLQRRRTLLHEFAHAWDRRNLDEADRQRLLDVLRVDVWLDEGHEHDWEDRGVERLAEVFVHGLLDQPRRPVKIPMECAEMAEAFEAAAGVEPLGPGLPWCMG